MYWAYSFRSSANALSRSSVASCARAFSPEFDWEKQGEVNNVVFPTSTALFGDTLFIYYEAADERIATASLSLSALTQELSNKNLK